MTSIGKTTSGILTLSTLTGGSSQVASNLFPVATGGTETTFTANGTNYKTHTFTGIGRTTLQVSTAGLMTVLIVGGGGGGGGYNGPGGGGGGGGVVYNESILIPTGAILVTVGGGGANGLTTAADYTPHGKPGNPSGFYKMIALGGGGGNQGYYNLGPQAMKDGGNGGGGGGAYTGAEPKGYSVQNKEFDGSLIFGHDGGQGGPYAGDYSGGGGGGAGAVGQSGAQDTNPGTSSHGGGGIYIDITGQSVAYGGGGGAGVAAGTIGMGGPGGGGDGGLSAAATAGTNGLGGGGGGGVPGGLGGSGIVIIRYAV